MSDQSDDTTPDTPSSMNGMKGSVRAIFPLFTDRFEGRISYLYTDVFGLVTTARGLLVDYGYRRTMIAGVMGPMGASSPAPALTLGWHRSGADPSRPSDQEISDQWWIVKRAWPGKQSTWCEHLTSMRLYLSDIDNCTYTKIDQMWGQLLKRFPSLPNAPACAQLGLVSMAWAMGPAFNFPQFATAFLHADWGRCADQCAMNATNNPGLVPRNTANKRLFVGAIRDADIQEALSEPQT